MSATRANVRELVRAIRHLFNQSNVKISGESSRLLTLHREDVNDVFSALRNVEAPPASKK